MNRESIYKLTNKTMTKLITPETLRGTRDFLPADMAKREYVLGIIKSVFVRFGYDSIETPAIEYAKTILGKYGDEGSKQTYTFEDNGGRKIALRFDQTVPFARVVAANYQNLPMPFKRYQIQPVWRADRPAKGRFREFYQCDIDIIGTTNLLAEGEVMQVMYQVFKSLGFSNFVIKFNSRRLINSILDSLNIAKQDQTAVVRILDKLEKIGAQEILKEWSGIINEKTAQELLKIVDIKGPNADKLKALKNYQTDEIEELIKICGYSKIHEDNLKFDPTLARGLDYYTGVTFEVVLPDIEMGSLCGGGRYDDLCGLFTEAKLSGVGVAFGFDRIILGMEEMKMFKDISLNSKVLVTYFDENTLQNSIEIANELQNAGINTEIYFQPDKIGKQIKYADKKSIPFIVLCGPDESAKGEVKVKMMDIGKEKTIPRNQVVSYLKGFN